jgi:signal transduction histidine kinase
LESAIDQAARAITEGRDAVQGLRASTIVTNDLAPALRTLGDELASHEARQPKGAVFEVEVEGVPRDLHPILRDEIYRVAGEALRNAFRHAHAMRIEVEIRYDDRYLRVRVRDDGKGIDAHVLDGGGSTGHYGVAGMYERASLIGGKLTVWSELESGTEVELTVPASVAYAKSSVDPPPVLSGTGM